MKRISIVGSGNVASFLAKAWYHAGVKIVEIHSKNKEHAEQLAQHVEANAIDNLSNLNPAIDYLVFAVNDDALESCIEQVNENHTFCWLHTSGTKALNVFSKKASNFAVFYPLQTFSKQIPITELDFPILLECSNLNLENNLTELAHTLSQNVLLTNSEKRKKIHLAAVFACNFSNHLYVIANEILKNEHSSLNLILPLIKETVAKLDISSAEEAQTGPAIRNDQEVIQSQLNLLKDDSSLKQLYQLFTERIQNYSK